MNTDKHIYPSLEGEREDTISHERNIVIMKDMVKKNNPNCDAIRQLMSRTFYCRRVSILDDPTPKSVQDIVEQYPFLRKAVFVSSR